MGVLPLDPYKMDIYPIQKIKIQHSPENQYLKCLLFAFYALLQDEPIKQNLDINPHKQNDITNKILITIFSMIAELERDFISERTKEGLRATVAKGIKLGKPKGVLQKSMYDKDKEQIFHLHALGVPIGKIISTHIKYGKYWSLKNYIEKRYKSNSIQ